MVWGVLSLGVTKHTAFVGEKAENEVSEVRFEVWALWRGGEVRWSLQMRSEGLDEIRVTSIRTVECSRKRTYMMV